MSSNGPHPYANMNYHYAKVSSLYFQKPLYELNVFKGENGRCSRYSKCFRILSFVDYPGLCLFMCLLVCLFLFACFETGSPYVAQACV